MSEYKRRIFIAGVLAVILVALLAGASYYLIPPETMQYPSPKPVPTAAPKPIPTPTPPPPGTTPIPTIPPGPRTPVKVEVVSTEGFSYTYIGDGNPVKVPVLHQGTSGNVTLIVYSLDEKNHNVSLDLSVSGMNKEFEGVSYRFYPSTIELMPKGKVKATLVLKADSDAPNGLYLPMLSVYTEGKFRYGTTLDSYILVSPYTPAYIFHIIAETEIFALSPTTGEATHTRTPPPFPTPIPTPPPPEPWEPEIRIARGEEAYIIFYIYADVENPTLTLNLTYKSGALPEGINAYVTPDPLKIVQNPCRDKTLLLTLKVDPDVPEGTYRIVAKCTVNGVAYERVFNLKVVGP